MREEPGASGRRDPRAAVRRCERRTNVAADLGVVLQFRDAQHPFGLSRAQKCYWFVNVAPRQHLDRLGFFPIFRSTAIRKPVGRMTARTVRFIIACFVMLSALLTGAGAEAFECGEYRTDPVSQHGVGASHASHEGSSGADDGGSDGVLHEAVGCHNAGSGCPGCIVPFDVMNAAPNAGRITYLLSDHVGRSIKLADSFRPPIASL